MRRRRIPWSLAVDMMRLCAFCKLQMNRMLLAVACVDKYCEAKIDGEIHRGQTRNIDWTTSITQINENANSTSIRFMYKNNGIYINAIGVYTISTVDSRWMYSVSDGGSTESISAVNRQVTYANGVPNAFEGWFIIIGRFKSIWSSVRWCAINGTNHCPIHERLAQFSHVFVCARKSHWRDVEFVVSANWYYFASKSITHKAYSGREAAPFIYFLFTSPFSTEIVLLWFNKSVPINCIHTGARAVPVWHHISIYYVILHAVRTHSKRGPMPILCLVWLMGRRKRRVWLYQCNTEW